MRIFNIVKESIVDGPGLRTTIFFQGCTHGCPGCHNPESHDFNGGEEYSLEEIIRVIDSDKLSTGVTFSGGDPMDQFSDSECSLELVKLTALIKARRKNLGMYTGYTIGQVREFGSSLVSVCPILFSNLDWIVTEPFVASKKSIECAFRGSTNQRVYRPEVTNEKPNRLGLQFHDITEQWDSGIF